MAKPESEPYAMITYRLATQADNPQLIALTAASPMEGDVSLRIDRHPDFFSLLRKRGESRVFVALDGGRIVGALCVSVQQVYVGGEVRPLHYIGDFKVAGSYRNQGIGLRLCDELAGDIVPRGADLAFLNVSRGNSKPLHFFKSRPGVPDFVNIGLFRVYQLPGTRKKISGHSFRVERTAASEELTAFLNAHYRRREMGPVITAESIREEMIFCIRQNNNLVAAMCLSDVMPMKQNVVVKMSFRLRGMLKLLDLLTPVTRFSKMPRMNQPVRTLYIRYFVADQRLPEASGLLLDYARNFAYERSFSFVSIGLHEKDPMQKLLAGRFRIRFNSVGMLVSIKDHRDLTETILNGIPFEDYSLV